MGQFDDPWDPDEALTSLTAERQILDRTDKDIAREIIDTASPLAARSLVHIAMTSANEKVRLDAAKYILERSLGKVVAEDTGGSELGPIESLLGDGVFVEMEAFANGERGGEV